MPTRLHGTPPLPKILAGFQAERGPEWAKGKVREPEAPSVRAKLAPLVGAMVAQT